MSAQLKLHAGAYIHKYEQAGCEAQTLHDAAEHMMSTVTAYETWFNIS